MRNGNSTKCRKCSSKSTRKNELNNKYNQLTVIKELGPKNNRIMWLCSCSCGNEIAVSGTDLRTGKVQSCGKCPDKKSLGEKEIISLLEKNNIKYFNEYTFKDFKYDSGISPRFDFYLPDFNCIIEFDGKQHFLYQKNTNYWNNKENYEKTIQRDNLKNNYCFNNNICLIRLPYYIQSKIKLEDLLPETSQYIINRKD